MKGGGADVRVLRRDVLGPRAEKLLRNARNIAEQTSPLVGFVIVAWNDRGGYKIGADASADDDNPVTLTLLPSYIADVVRRELVTRQTVRDTLADEYIVHPPGSG